MTDTTSPSPAPTADPAAAPRAGRRGRRSSTPWLLAVLLGLVVAQLGVSSALGSIQGRQYAEVRATSVYLLRHGNEIRTSTERLEVVNARDHSLLKDAGVALAAGDMAGYRRLLAQAEVFNVERQQLQQQVKDFQAAFDEANKR